MQGWCELLVSFNWTRDQCWPEERKGQKFAAQTERRATAPHLDQVMHELKVKKLIPTELHLAIERTVGSAATPGMSA